MVEFFEGECLGFGDEEEDEDEPEGVPGGVPPECALGSESSEESREGDGDDEVARGGELVFLVG